MAIDYESNAGNIWTEIGNELPRVEYIRDLAHRHGEVDDAASYMDEAVTALENAKDAIAVWSTAQFKALAEEAGG